MSDLVPIKVQVLRGPSGAVYPAFNGIASECRGRADWAKFIDRFGGFVYDDRSGFGVADNENPNPDTQFACCLVPLPFARAAVAGWTDRVEILTEAAWEAFYNGRSASLAPTEHLDTTVLQGIVARVALEEKGIAPKPSAEISVLRKRCLDPSDPLPGIRRNRAKTWEALKAAKGYTIAAPYAKG